MFVLAVNAGLHAYERGMVMAVYAALLYMPEGSDWMTPEVREEHHAFGVAASQVIGAAVALYPTGSATTITVAGGPGAAIDCRAAVRQVARCRAKCAASVPPPTITPAEADAAITPAPA